VFDTTTLELPSEIIPAYEHYFKLKDDAKNGIFSYDATPNYLPNSEVSLTLGASKTMTSKYQTVSVYYVISCHFPADSRANSEHHPRPKNNHLSP
jgi:hypothetical protein